VKSRGRIRIGDRDAAHDSPGRRLAAGLAHVPEDRHRGGLILDASVAENLALNRKDITGRFRINRDAVRKNAVKRIAELDIRPADSDAIVRDLSGGNQQKVVLGRELSRPNLRVVVAAQPTRGVDLAASLDIHAELTDAARRGAGVLVISADLDELRKLASRILVLARGRFVAELPRTASDDEVGRLMLGLTDPGKTAREEGSA
jgi:simple sugar transport system ATP-binding protein